MSISCGDHAVAVYVDIDTRAEWCYKHAGNYPGDWLVYYDKELYCIVYCFIDQSIAVRFKLTWL